MTRSTIRRATVLAAGTVAAAGLLAGCSAGQIAETAQMKPAVQGANAEAEAPPAGSVKVRDVSVVYRSPKGYPEGGTAPLEVRIFNDTPQAVTVRVRPGNLAARDAQSVSAATMRLTGRAADGEAAPAVPPPVGDAPAVVEIPAAGYVILSPSEGRYVELVDLGDALTPGMSVPLVFQFSNGVELQVSAPVAPPLTAVPRGTPVQAEEDE